MNIFKNTHLIRQRFKYNPLSFSSRKKGIALIMAMTSLMLMVYISSEVSRDASIEFIVNSNELSRLKAYYNARNGMQIALLRVKIFQQIGRANLPPGFSTYIDQIWKFPFAWPLPISEDTNGVDKETIKKSATESFLEGSYFHTIVDEGSKIDLNDLVSPSKTLQELTRKQIITIFENEIENNEEFRNQYQNTRFDELVGRIIDWMSDVYTSKVSGDKRAYFSSLGENYPPNRGFRTVDELRLVPGMNEDFFKLLAPRITIYGMKAINPNTATLDVIKSLDAGITDQVIKEIKEKRDDTEKGEAFTGQGDKCRENFKAFIERAGARLNKEFDKIPMLCDKTFNFKIESNGIYGAGKQAMKRTITAIVVDLSQAATQIKNASALDKDQTKNDPNAAADPAKDPAAADKSKGSSGSKSGTPTQEPLPKGPPRVVYWTES